MEIVDFKKILFAFADEQRDVDVRLGRVVATIHDDLIDASLEYSADGDLTVKEHGRVSSAKSWILTRIAKLPQLADRILSSIAETPVFVAPAGSLVDDLAADEGEDPEHDVRDTVEVLTQKINSPVPGATSVIYLTSDAGEGKTTLINTVARIQATRLKDRTVSRLLLPIPLGGKSFLTFDDAVIAALVNRFRFPYFYYGAFIELVKLGVLVPAFDGYEEMLVEGNKDEAISALGDLIKTLDSQGVVVVAARKAFFEYQSFATQARLLDSLGDRSVSFSRLKLARWSREQFLEYGHLRGVNNPLALYDQVANRLGSQNHPLLTRAVLVRRLFDVSIGASDDLEFLSELTKNPDDFFFTFVDVIITREATEKWLNRATDAGEALIGVEEHHQLLRSIAMEMWQTSSTSLRYEVVDLLVDLHCEARKKPPVVVRQIKERIKQHSLLAVDPSKGQAITFDHDDFRNFFLGEGLGAVLASLSEPDLRLVASVDLLPIATVEQAIRAHHRFGGDPKIAISLLEKTSGGELGLSYLRENCGALLLWLVDMNSGVATTTRIEGMSFPANGLAGKKLINVEFRNCYFQATSLMSARLEDVTFWKCHFERIELNADRLDGVTLLECTIDSLFDRQYEANIFDPAQIEEQMRLAGAKTPDHAAETSVGRQRDLRLVLVERFLRVIARTTQVDEDIIKLRLGKAAQQEFFGKIMPELLQRGILVEVPWKGRGVQRRYKLNVPLAELQSALAKSKGSFDELVAHFD